MKTEASEVGIDTSLIKKISIFKAMIEKILVSNLWSYFILKIMPHLRFTNKHAKMNGKQFEEFMDRIFIGDIIVCTDDSSATTISGEWAHAAFCINHKETGPNIAQMTHKGLTFDYFFDLCKEADRVAIYRCNDYSEAHIMNMIYFIKTLKKKVDPKYDTRFAFGLDSFYCSELVYAADKDAGLGTPILKVDLSDILGIGHEYISPDGLTLASNITLVYDSNNYK